MRISPSRNISHCSGTSSQSVSASSFLVDGWSSMSREPRSETVHPLSSHVNLIMHDLGMLMRGEIIWDKSASAGSSCAWGSFKSASNPCLRDVHEYLLVFSRWIQARANLL